MSDDYHKDIKNKNTLLLREKLNGLPPFLKEFFRGIENTTSSRTRINYAYDYEIFFNFLAQNKFTGKQPKDLTFDDLAAVAADDIEEYMEYVTLYIRRAVNADGEITETERENENRGKCRKLSSLRTMFAYFYKKRKIPANPAELVDLPKITEKNIIKLEPDEAARLLDAVEDGGGLSQTQKAFHESTKARDLAILTLLLGTGIRVSECVGLNIEHLDFSINAMKVTRKGGDEAIVYFGDEVADALSDYLDEREDISALAGHESALFLSLQRKRLTDRAIQNLVKKYAGLVTTLKTITPHKLRKTYGTSLYNETGDIYLVASVLGHSSVETTKKYYAAMDENKKKAAARAFAIRYDKNKGEIHENSDEN